MRLGQHDLPVWLPFPSLHQKVLKFRFHERINDFFPIFKGSNQHFFEANSKLTGNGFKKKFNEQKNFFDFHDYADSGRHGY
jgi:hypothetical protein